MTETRKLVVRCLPEIRTGSGENNFVTNEAARIMLRRALDAVYVDVRHPINTGLHVKNPHSQPSNWPRFVTFTFKSMKTPQEQADKINSQLAELLFAHTKADLDGYTTRIKQEIPLTELIAVAQAAAERRDRIFFFGEQPNELDLAVDALRATGKVEL